MSNNKLIPDGYSVIDLIEGLCSTYSRAKTIVTPIGCPAEEYLHLIKIEIEKLDSSSLKKLQDSRKNIRKAINDVECHPAFLEKISESVNKQILRILIEEKNQNR